MDSHNRNESERDIGWKAGIKNYMYVHYQKICRIEEESFDEKTSKKTV